MTRHMLLISLGPVQDFIASARRCQDLWFGSWLLSDLARTTAEEVKNSASGEEQFEGQGDDVRDFLTATADRYSKNGVLYD